MGGGYSDSEDCNCSEGGSSITAGYLGGGGCPHYPLTSGVVVDANNNNFDNISEHSSDNEETDSNDDLGDLKGVPGADKIKKPKKKKQEQPDKKKKTDKAQKPAPKNAPPAKSN